MIDMFDMPRYLRGKSKMAAAKSLGERIEAGEDMKQSKFRTVEEVVAWAEHPGTKEFYGLGVNGGTNGS